MLSNPLRSGNKWQIIYDKTAIRQLEQLAAEAQTAIREGLQNENWIHLPRRTGGSWMALPSIMPIHIGDYRILCKIKNTADIVDVIEIKYEPR